MSTNGSRPNQVSDREFFSIEISNRKLSKYITILDLIINYKVQDGSFTQSTLIELLNTFKESMNRKLAKADAVTVTLVMDNHFFIESDKGNFVAIKKNDEMNTVVLEEYNGNVKDYLDEWEISRPKMRPKSGCFGDLIQGVYTYRV